MIRRGTFQKPRRLDIGPDIDLLRAGARLIAEMETRDLHAQSADGSMRGSEHPLDTDLGTLDRQLVQGGTVLEFIVKIAIPRDRIDIFEPVADAGSVI
jgi:hypothetical protein